MTNGWRNYERNIRSRKSLLFPSYSGLQTLPQDLNCSVRFNQAMCDFICCNSFTNVSKVTYAIDIFTHESVYRSSKVIHGPHVIGCCI